MDRIWDLAIQAGPFAVVGTCIVIWWLVQSHAASRAGYVERIDELEAQIKGLQEARLEDYKKVTDLVTGLTQSQVAAAAAMSERNRTSTELTDAVREMLLHVKFLLQNVGVKTSAGG